MLVFSTLQMTRVFDTHFKIHFCSVFTITLPGRLSWYYYSYFANREKRLSNEDSIGREKRKSVTLDHVDLALNSGSHTA